MGDVQRNEIQSLLGLRGTAESRNGRIKAGSRVKIIGKVLRIHSSGFIVVEIEGAPQNAVIMNAKNVEEIHAEP